MIKKAGVKKKIVQKKTIMVPKRKIIPASKKPQTENILIENFIALQKVNTHLSIKLDKLTNQISSLLELFEISAKTLAEKESDIQNNNVESKEILEKIEGLLEQNKTIARGVALMHEKDEIKPNTPQQTTGPSYLKPRQNMVGPQTSNPSRFKQLPRN